MQREIYHLVREQDWDVERLYQGILDYKAQIASLFEYIQNNPYCQFNQKDKLRNDIFNIKDVNEAIVLHAAANRVAGGIADDETLASSPRQSTPSPEPIPLQRFIAIRQPARVAPQPRLPINRQISPVIRTEEQKAAILNTLLGRSPNNGNSAVYQRERSAPRLLPNRGVIRNSPPRRSNSRYK